MKPTELTHPRRKASVVQSLKRTWAPDHRWCSECSQWQHHAPLSRLLKTRETITRKHPPSPKSCHNTSVFQRSSHSQPKQSQRLCGHIGVPQVTWGTHCEFTCLSRIQALSCAFVCLEHALEAQSDTTLLDLFKSHSVSLPRCHTDAEVHVTLLGVVYHIRARVVDNNTAVLGVAISS